MGMLTSAAWRWLYNCGRRRFNVRAIGGRRVNSVKKSGGRSVRCRGARRMSKMRPVWGARMQRHISSVRDRYLLLSGCSSLALQSSASPE